jgi:predicted nucleic acid-binding protein
VTYLLDTNVVSELRRARPDAGVVSWVESVDSDDLHVSVLVVGEVRQGIERVRGRGDLKQAAELEAWLETLVRDYGGRIVPVSSAVAEAWGRLNAIRPLPVVDGLMAATALVHDLTLVTRDTRTLAGSGVPLVDPFARQAG